MASVDEGKGKTKEETGSESTLRMQKSKAGDLLKACMKLQDLSAVFGKEESHYLCGTLMKKTISTIVIF